MTSWTDLEASGRGDVVYLLEIPGVGVFSTYSYTPTDSWFTTAGYGAARVYPWLMRAGLGPIEERIDFIDGSLEVGALTFRIADVGGAMTALVKDWRSRTWTWITTNLTATATVIPAVNTASFPTATSIGYLGQEAFTYAASSNLAFKSVSRGALGTTPRTYRVKLNEPSGVEEQPVVTDGVASLVGRRAILHGCAMVGGAPGSTSVLYRGRIGNGIKAGKGMWTIPTEHVSACLKQKFAQNLPQTPILPGYYMCGDPGTRTVYGTTVEVDSISGTVANIIDASAADVRVQILISEGSYDANSLVDAWNAASSSSSLTIKPQLIIGSEKVMATAPAVADKALLLFVRKYDPLWCLGFDEGMLSGESNAPFLIEGNNAPRLLCAQWGYNELLTSPRVQVEDGTQITDALYVTIKGQHWAKVSSVTCGTTAATNDYVTLMPLGQCDPIPGHRSRAWVVEDEQDDLVLKHAFVFGSPSDSDVTLKTALKRSLGILTNQVEPMDWCSTGMVADDLDWTDFDTATASVQPTGALKWCDCVTEGLEVWAEFGAWFALFGIAPRITSEGRIGFKRLETPTLTSANSIAVNSAIWSIVGAAEMQATVGDAPLINAILVRHSRNYREDSGGGGAGAGAGSWGQPIKINWRDGWNQLGRTRTLKLDVRGMVIGSFYYGINGTLEEVAEKLNAQLRATHFGIFGREGATIAVPCVWLAKQFDCGDIVELTHELAPDTIQGAIGVTSRLGIITGKIQSLDGSDPDTLEIRLGGAANAYGIAPCARGTAWTNAASRLSFSNAAIPEYEQSGANDLTRFATLATTNDLPVRLWRRDTLTNDGFNATINAGTITTNAVVFTTNPFTNLPTNGVWMTLRGWTNASAAERDYAFIATEAASPILGTNDDPMEWTI